MAAARHNRAEVVSLLLNEPTIEVNRGEYYYNWTALHVACYHNSETALRRLLAAAGVDFNPLDSSNVTPIMEAVTNGSIECVHLMSAVAEVDLDVKFPDGRSLEER